MSDQHRVLILFIIGLIAIGILVNQLQNVMYGVQNNKLSNYTLSDGLVVSCADMKVFDCGIVLENCANNVTYYCFKEVKG